MNHSSRVRNGPAVLLSPVFEGIDPAFLSSRYDGGKVATAPLGCYRSLLSRRLVFSIGLEISPNGRRKNFRSNKHNMKKLTIVLFVCLAAVAGMLVCGETTKPEFESPIPTESPKWHDAHTGGIMYCCSNHSPRHCAYGYQLKDISQQFGCTGWTAQRE
jgi:hypothetical protein